MSKLALFVALSLCLCAFATAQDTTYVQIANYLTPNCTSSAAEFQIFALATCISNSTGDSTSFQVVNNATYYTINDYSDSNCQNFTDASYYPVNACDGQGSLASPSTGFPSGLTGNVGVSAYYPNGCSATQTGTPLAQDVLVNTCIDISALAGIPASALVTCNSTFITTVVYALNTVCTTGTEYQRNYTAIGCDAATNSFSQCVSAASTTGNPTSSTSSTGAGSNTTTTTTTSTSSTSSSTGTGSGSTTAASSTTSASNIVAPCAMLLAFVAMLLAF